MGLFGNRFTSREDDKTVVTPDNTPQTPEKATGKIIKVNKSQEGGGYGFISSKDIPFTRIFFHWTALLQDTLPFMKLEEKMVVEFKPVQFPDGRWRAHKIKVLEGVELEDYDVDEESAKS